ncbi:MAG TPA: DUF4124 domain-containing protein [Gammaproteobacteria bacterium]
MVTKARVAPFLVVLAAVVAVPIYKWVDETGKVHYSDQPPAAEYEPEELALLPAPSEDAVVQAQARLNRLMAEQRASREQRATAQEQARLERELEEAQRAQRLERCLIAQQNLHTLEIKRPVYRVNEHGEIVYVDDQERAAEVQRMREDLDAYCD